MAVGRKEAGGSIVAEIGEDRMKTKKAALYSNDGGSDGLVESCVNRYNYIPRSLAIVLTNHKEITLQEIVCEPSRTTNTHYAMYATYLVPFCLIFVTPLPQTPHRMRHLKFM